MIICTACGSRNEEHESFCGECGAYLEWEGERVAPPTEPEPPLERHAQQPPGAPAPPSAEPTSPPSAPAAVRPGAATPKPRHPNLPPEERRPAPGESICGSCGAGNAPTRKFCRRCGVDLTDAPTVRNPPWWRRISRQRDAAPVAGYRPKAKARRPHRGRWLALIVVGLVVAGLLTRPLWSAAGSQVLDRVKGTKTVNPTGFAASSTATGHSPRAVRDGVPNVFWAPDASRSPAGQYIQVGFDAPFRLVYLRVFDGAGEQLKDYLAESSVRQIRITLTRKGAGPVVRTFTLTDKPGNQDLHVAVSDVIAVRLTIESVYRPAPGALVALGELEFLGRK